MICALFKYGGGGQIKNSKMDGACSTYGREGKCVQSFGEET